MAKYGIVSQALRGIHRRNGPADQDQQQSCRWARVMAGKWITLKPATIFAILLIADYAYFTRALPHY